MLFICNLQISTNVPLMPTSVIHIRPSVPIRLEVILVTVKLDLNETLSSSAKVHIIEFEYITRGAL